MPVPYTFGTATSSIPLSQLDSNFATAITIGNTAVQLGNTVTTLNNLTLANVTISSGNVTITNVSVTTANVSGTANVQTLAVTQNATVAGNVTVTGNVSIATGNLTFSGSAQRITGDFSNATVANRVMFQTSTTNGFTYVAFMPNGTSAISGTEIYNSSDPANASWGRSVINGTEYRFQSSYSGSGTYLPMTFYTGGSEAMRIGSGASSATDKGTVGIGYTSLTGVGNNGLAVLGNVGIGTASPSYKLDAVSTDGIFKFTKSGGATGYLLMGGSSANFSYDTSGNYAWAVASNELQAWTAGTKRMVIDASGNVGIGTTSPATTLHLRSAVCNVRLEDADTSAYANVGVDNSGSMYLQADPANSQASSTMYFSVDGTERMRIDSSGNVLVTNPAGLGYGTGSGGTVTQATSKSTAVTLNKPTGQITMNNAALAAGASVNFALNNSLASGTDTMLCALNGGGVTSSNNYTIQTVYVATGVAGFRLTNVSGGSLSEAVVISFTLIKGATS